MSSSGLWGPQWSPDEIAELVVDHGVDDWHGINCVAIALAESGGFIHAVNLVDHNPDDAAYLSCDLGLWQVNSYWHPNLSMRDSFTPVSQVQYVLDVAKRKNAWGYDWHLWTTWNNGLAHRRLGEARRAVNNARALRGKGPI